MRTIYKYPLEITDEQVIQIHDRAVFLDAQVQNGVLCVWFIVDTDEPPALLKLRIIGTGNPIEVPLDMLVPLASVQMGPFVWHLFEEMED